MEFQSVETQYFASPNGKSNRGDNVVETQYFASPNGNSNRSDTIQTQNIASLRHKIPRN